MARHKIGLRIDSLPDGPREALAKAAALQMDGVEIPAARGEFSPRELDRSGRRELRHYLQDLKLELAAFGADVKFRFEDENRIEYFIDSTRAILDLAVELRVRIVTTAIGSVPSQPSEPRYTLLRDILKELGDDSANRGCCLALSCGYEPPDALQRFLDDLSTPGVRVNYDPANMVFSGYDPAASIVTLGKHIVAVRARDGRRYLDGTKEELPLGKGDVPWDGVFEALDGIDYSGTLMIARRRFESPEKEIEEARKFLLDLSNE